MQTNTWSFGQKAVRAFFAAALCLTMVPATALAEVADGQDVTQLSHPANETVEGTDAYIYDETPSDGSGGTGSDAAVSDGSQDGSVATGSILPDGEDGTQDDITTNDGSQAAIPAAGVINQTMPLEVVAQQESTRSYFLAQTLESTKTVPIVSANLPLDKGTNQGPQAGADGGIAVGSEGEVTDGDPSVSAEGEGGSEPEGGDDSDESDESDLGVSDDAFAMVPGVSGESTVVGSFTYLGMTFAVEPGGESVALVAVDYSKLPEEFVQKQILVVPDAATPDGMDYYSVTRIAADAFSSLIKDGANPDYTGCIELFSDEELLAEAGIDPAEVAEFLPQDGTAAAAASDGGSADADFDIQQGDESLRYEDDATTEESTGDGENGVVAESSADDGEPVIVSDTVVLSNGEDEFSDDIRSIVSMDGDVATLDDGSTYTFANPLEGCAGILALGVPASVTSIEDDAFAGFDTLQYLVVSEDNPEYASFDGALYSADLTNLRLIPEGRVGAVRVASSATGVDPEVFSHCPSVDALVADAEKSVDWLLEMIDAFSGGKTCIYLSTSISEVSSILPGNVVMRLVSSVVDLKLAGFSVASSAQESVLTVASDVRIANLSETSVSRFESLKSSAIAAYDYRVDAPTERTTISAISGQRSLTVLVYDPAGEYGFTSTGGAAGYHDGPAEFTSGLTPAPIPYEGTVDRSYRSESYIVLTQHSLHGGRAAEGLYYSPKLSFYRQYQYNGDTSMPSLCSTLRIVRGDVAINPKLCLRFSSFTLAGTTYGETCVIFPPPYTIAATFHGSWHDEQNDTTIHGEWDGGSEKVEEESRSDFTQTFDSGILEGTLDDVTAEIEILTGKRITGSGVNTTYVAPTPDPKNNEYAFVGWNEDPKATAETTTGWYYRVDGRYGAANTSEAQITKAKKSVDLYAIYQKGYPVTWDKTRFGADGARFIEFGANVSNAQAVNTHSGTKEVDGVNDIEVAVFEHSSDSVQLNATSRFPEIARGDEGSATTFLGWTNNADGSAPDRANADGSSKASAYFTWDDGVIKLDKDNFYIVRESAADKLTKDLDASDILEKYPINDFRNATFYAVWETDVTYSAAGGYGGKFENNAGSDTVTVTVFNNRPIEQEDLPANDKTASASVGVGTLDKTLVPGQKDRAGYDGSKWIFKGWTAAQNPNGASGGTTQSASGLGCRTGNVTDADRGAVADVSGTNALRPDGPTTYYGVWECGIDWAAPDPPSGPKPGDPSATITAGVDAAAAASVTGDFLYGYALNAPGVVDTPESHAFLRWTDSIGTVVGSSTGSYTVRTGGTVNASWGPNVYKVAFKDKDGNDRTDAAVASLFVKYGDGWYRDGACTDKVNAVLAGGHIGTTERAGFELIGYSRDASATTPEFFYSGTSASDYAFSATEHPAANDIFSDSTTSSGDTWTEGDLTLKVAYLYPVWKATATWVWDNDGATADATEPKTIDNGLPTVVCRDQGARPGYTAAGWKVAYANGETDDAVYTTGQTIVLKGDATITAQWTPVLYDVSLDLGEVDYDGEVFRNDGGSAGLVGSVSMSGSGGTKGTSVTAKAQYDVTHGSVTLPTFSRPGFSLKGWTVAQQPSGTGANGTLTDQVAADASGYAPYAFTTAPGTDQVRGAIALVAVWTAAVPYSITPQKTLDGVVAAGDYYDASKADIPSTYTVSGTGELENLVPRTSPSGVPGYRFVGWSADKAGFLLDAATGEALSENEVSDSVRIATGLVDWKPTLTAHFETVYYDLTVDLALPDAAGAYSSSANWTRPDASENAFAYKSNKLMGNATGGYSLYDASVPLPTPSRAGQVFKGWKVEKLDGDGNVVATDVADLVQTGSDWALPVSLGKLGHYRLTAQWGASEYAIAFGNIEHTADKESGAFVSATNPVKAAYDGASRTFEFTGDDLTSGGAIQVSAPDYDKTRYTGFIGWYLPAGLVPAADAVNAWSRDGDRYYLPAFTVSQANLGVLFSAKDEAGSYLPLSLEARFSMKADHTAALDLDGGKFVTPDAAWTEGSDGTWSLTYAADVSKRMLPEVTRYGYEFTGWVLTDAGTGAAVEELENVTPSGDGVKRLNVPLSRPSEDDEEGYWIPADAVGDRVYTAQWRALADRVEFDYNAEQTPGTGSNGPAPQTVTFGSVIPSGLPAPQREGYEFRGYFDTAAATGGVQYLTATMTPARTWDKAPVYSDEAGTEIVPHTLYARWTPVPPEGTNPDNEPIPGTIAPAPPAEPDPALSTRATFSAKKGERSTTVPTPGFDAFYNGWFTRAIDDTVTVSIDSYSLAGITAKDIYDAFERPGEAKPYLLGFVVDSTKSIVAFSDIARGASFSFSFKVTDMESDISDAASFALAGLKLTALYTDVPYDFTNPGGGEPPSILPKDGDEVLATFDAAGGSFADGSSFAYTQTTYRSGSTEHVALPAAPAREGYEFTGWSLARACGSEADHAKNPTNALFHIDDTLAKHYIAHWAEKTYRVHLYRNDGTSSHLETEVVFGSTAGLAELLGAEAYEPPAREGYLFLGYFDEETAGTQYYASDGAAAKPFDKTAGPSGYVSLYARWLSLGGGSGQPGDIDPTNPFPPHDDVTIVPTAAPNNVIRVVARDGLGNASTLALDGTYDGYYAHTSTSDDAAVSVYSYRAANVESSVRKIIERFEARNDPAVSGGEHLQGFRVESTGAFVSVVELWNGTPFTLVCKTTDLDAAHDPASAVFLPAGAATLGVTAVYGPTSPIAPDNDEDWPEWADPDDPASGTRVYNTFDARGGLFADGARFKTVDSGLGLSIRQPDAAPSYDNVDATYLFVGWFDAKGDPFDAGAMQTSTVPTTYYAKYEHVELAFRLHDVQDGVKDVHKTSVEGDGAVGGFSVYKGQELTEAKTNALGQTLPPASEGFEANALPAREGYDFIGWFYKEPATGALVPFYLTKAADNRFAAQYIQRQGWKVVSAYTNTATSGWGDVTGAADAGDAVDLYALWNVKSYTVKWTYNWTDRDYVYTELDDAGADMTDRAPVTVEYGDDVAGLIPSIKDPAYSFLGWYAGKTVTGNDEALVAFEPVSYTPGGHDADARPAKYSDAVPGGREPSYFTVEDGMRRFEPANVEGIDDRDRAFEFFACFVDEAVRYNYRIYFGKSADAVHGHIANVGTIVHDPELGMDYLSYTYMPASETNLSRAIGSTSALNHISVDAGYSLSGFYRSPESTEAVPEPVTIPQWSTGLQVFYLGWNANSYHVRLTMGTLDLGGEELSPPPGTVVLNGTAAYDLDLASDDGRAIALSTPTGALGYVFKGWKRCDADGTLWASDPVVADATIVFDAGYVEDVFGGGSEGCVYYGAVWEPLAYQVRFHVQRDVDDGFDLFDVYTLMGEGAGDAEHPSSLTLPYPHTKGVSDIFAYWSLETFDGADACEAWTSGTELTLSEMFAMQKRLGLAEATDTMEDTARAGIDVYAQWRDVVGADVPLQVNMLFDPFMPNDPAQGKIITNSEESYRYDADGAVVANGWVGTTSASDVRIESLTFERGDASVFELEGGGDGGSALDLLIYGGGAGEEAGEPLRLNLGVESTVVLRDDATSHGATQGGHIHGDRMYLADHGMAGAISAGNPLWLYYDLDIKTADGTLMAYRRLVGDMLDATEPSGSHIVRKSALLAKLYYTIGVVPRA